MGGPRARLSPERTLPLLLQGLDRRGFEQRNIMSLHLWRGLRRGRSATFLAQPTVRALMTLLLYTY
jgi:hypothetical protein